MTSKRELIEEKLQGFKKFLDETVPPQNKHLLKQYENMTIEQFVENFLLTYQGSKDVKVLTRKMILRLEIADIHCDKLERYLAFFLEILDL